MILIKDNELIITKDCSIQIYHKKMSGVSFDRIQNLNHYVQTGAGAYQKDQFNKQIKRFEKSGYKELTVQ
jgi:hypothetical protein